jgi:hypothetical protein
MTVDSLAVFPKFANSFVGLFGGIRMQGSRYLLQAPTCRPTREECKQYVDLQRDAEAIIDEALALPQARSQWAAAIKPGQVALVRAVHTSGGAALDTSTLGPSTRLAVILGTREQLDKLASEELEWTKGKKILQRPQDGGGHDVVYVLALHEPSALHEADERGRVAHEPGGFEGLRAVSRKWTPPPLPMCVSA